MNDGADPVNRMFTLLSFPEAIPQTVKHLIDAIYLYKQHILSIYHILWHQRINRFFIDWQGTWNFRKAVFRDIDKYISK